MFLPSIFVKTIFLFYYFQFSKTRSDTGSGCMSLQDSVTGVSV